MGFLERAIRRGVSDAVGKAIGNAVQQAVEPKATELANKAADSIDAAAASVVQQSTYSQQQSVYQGSGLESALSNLTRSVESYATEAAKNMKLCPSCNEPSTADKKFCPKCGTKLPEATVADGAVCTSCGKQNSVGMKFCSDCGAKLPAAIEEEQRAQQQDDEVMSMWSNELPAYPVWNCGGSGFNLEKMDWGYMFASSFNGNNTAARQAVEQYRQLAMQNGFRMAGEYPSKEHLYKKVDGLCYHIDTEHCFDGDSDCPTIYFDINEPSGGYDYLKPEPKKSVSLKDLFGF